MFAIADQRSRTLHAGAEMRPRRWYTDEHAPPPRAARITSELWHYRMLAQRRPHNAAPSLERRLYVALHWFQQPKLRGAHQAGGWGGETFPNPSTA